MKSEVYDVIVIGAGVIGLGITFELSKVPGIKNINN